MTKPYNMRELLPRAKNLARRVAAARLRSPDEPKKTFGRLDARHPALDADFAAPAKSCV